MPFSQDWQGSKKPVAFITDMRQFSTLFFDCRFALTRFGPKLDKFGFDLNSCNNWFDSSLAQEMKPDIYSFCLKKTQMVSSLPKPAQELSIWCMH